MATEEEDGSAFRFFDLPAELRNRIYAKVTTKHVASYPRTDRPDLHNVPVSSLCLISRQFKQEYEKEVFRQSEIIFYYTVAHTVEQVLANIKKSASSRLIAHARKVTVQVHSVAFQLAGLKNLGEKLANNLWSLSTLRFELYASSYALEEPEKFSSQATKILDFIRDSIPLENNLKIEKVLFIQSQLYSSNPKNPGLLAIDDDPEMVVDYMNESAENHITYIATLPDKGSSLHDLDLRTHEAGTFHYDTLIKKVGKEMEHQRAIDEEEEDRERNEDGWFAGYGFGFDRPRIPNERYADDYYADLQREYDDEDY